MNILGICLSTGKGGLELYAHKAISALQQAGHHCHFAIAPDSFLRQRDWTVPLIELKPAFPLFPWLTARKLARYIDAHQIDVIHMHWNKDLNLVALAKMLSRSKPKLVYTRHMEITRSKRDSYHRALYSQVDKILTIAKFVQDQALRFLPLSAAQVELLYVGVSAGLQASEAECATLLPNLTDRANTFVIGMIGRIEHAKGQHVLVEALSKIKGEDCRVHVVMAGPIMDEAYFERLKMRIDELGLSEQVHYLGMSREPGKLMSCCDVVVLTTYCETFGLVLVEAMRVGTAVIGTNAGGVPEIISHRQTGLLFTPGDATQLVDQLRELCHDPSLRTNLAQAGKAYADTMFDERGHFARLETLLSSL